MIDLTRDAATLNGETEQAAPLLKLLDASPYFQNSTFIGSIAKAGTSAITAVATHGDRIKDKGLVFAATPASDFICGTQQLASMNLHVFTTGEGSPYGLALVPVVKVSSRTALAEKWHDLIDMDAGRIATGKATIEQVGWELFRFILDVASGRKKTWTEHWGLHNALVPFNPGPVT